MTAAIFNSNHNFTTLEGDTLAPSLETQFATVKPSGFLRATGFGQSGLDRAKAEADRVQGRTIVARAAGFSVWQIVDYDYTPAAYDDSDDDEGEDY